MIGTSPVCIAVSMLRDMIRDIFAAVGCDGSEATRIADHLVEANLAGHDSHGAVRTPRYVEWLRSGYIRAGQSMEIVSDGGAFVLIDGHFGFGQTVAPQAVALGIARAMEQGSCIVALRNAGHIGRVGAYAEQAVSAGLISIHMVNVAGSTLVAPFGGIERRFSTAPFAVGIPLQNRPVILDFATSRVAEGKVLVASQGGKPLPADALIGADGALSDDPHTLYGDYDTVGPRNAGGGLGAIRAFGDHKGSGLALACELLAGAFTGGGCAGPVTRRGRISNGMLSIFLSPKHFGTETEFQRIGQQYVDWVASSRPVIPGDPVMLPGEPEARTRQARLAEGIPLSLETWAALVSTAQALNVSIPEAQMRGAP